MEHSQKFETVKKWWTLFHKNEMISNAVVKGWITEAEYEETVGEPYLPINE